MDIETLRPLVETIFSKIGPELIDDDISCAQLVVDSFSNSDTAKELDQLSNGAFTQKLKVAFSEESLDKLDEDMKEKATIDKTKRPK